MPLPHKAKKEDDAESTSRYVYTFLLTLDGLTPTLQEDGSILLQNGDGETEYTIPAPYMMDAAGEYSDSVSYSLREDDAGWLLTVTADAAWLDDADRAYPVTVDPTIVSKKNTTTFSGGIASEHTASAEHFQNSDGRRLP